MRFISWLIGSVVALGMGCAAIAADAPKPLQQADVLGYLEQLVQWQREAASIETSANTARELIFQDTLQQNSLAALRSGFKFAQQQAAVSTPAEAVTPSSSDTSTPQQRMLQRAADNNQKITELRKQLTARNLPQAQRHRIQGTLRIILAKQELLKNLLDNITAASGGTTKDLTSKIDNLAREIPELNTDASKASKAKATDTASGTQPATARPVTSIFSLSGDLFTIARKQRELKEFSAQTEQLETSSRALLKGLRGRLDTITGEDDTQMSIDEQVATLKQTGSLIMPLGTATLWIVASETTLGDWQRMLNERFESLVRQLLLQAALLAFTLAIPLAISSVAKRAIKRYVPDEKRKRQAHNARRVLVGVVIVIILLLNFISDFSSFATFAGFMTAGLAVALQSVLLSLVGHFFFYGRYGVRPGDRVKVANVTGDIIKIGMMRFYLRELKENEEGTLAATGKIVTFPNSILFQPSAFYKYVAEVP